MEPLNLRAERWRISSVCFGLLVLLLGTILTAWDLLGILSRIAPGLNSTLRSAAMELGQYLIAFPLGAILISRVPSDPMEKYRLSPDQRGRYLLIAAMCLLTGGVIGHFVGNAAAGLFGKEPQSAIEELLGSFPLWFNLLFVVLLAPVWEELIFRKMLIDRLNRLGDRPAMVVSALLFALFHGRFEQFFYAFFAGLLFAYVYLRTGRIGYTIRMHMLVNLCFGLIPEYLLCRNNTVVLGIWSALELVLAAAGLVTLIVNRRKIRLLRGWVELPRFRWGHIVFGNPGMILLLLACCGMFAVNIAVM